MVLEQVPRGVQVELLVVAVEELGEHLFLRQMNWCSQCAGGLCRWIDSTSLALQAVEAVGPFPSARFAERIEGMPRPNRHFPPIGHRRTPSLSFVSRYPGE